MSYNNETNMYEGYIYQITNLINGHQYIGQTSVTIEHRWGQHKADSIKKSHCIALYKAFNKYGIENFSIEQIDFVINKTKKGLKEKLNVLEKNYIQQRKDENIELYNMTNGGDDSPERCKKGVIKYDLDGNAIAEYESILDAADQNNLKISHVWGCCDGRWQTANGYTYRYSDESFEKYPIVGKKSKTIYQYTVEGELINTYKNLKEAIEKTGVSNSALNRVLTQNIKRTCMNYIWSYEPVTDFSEYKITILGGCRVEKYDLNGELIETFKSISEASKSLGFKSHNPISKAIKSNKPYKGYLWKSVY